VKKVRKRKGEKTLFKIKEEEKNKQIKGRKRERASRKKEKTKY